MDTPTSALVRTAYPQFDWVGRGYGPATGSGGDPLDALVEEAKAYVTLVTYRQLDSTMPAIFAPTALRAVALRVAQDVLLGDDAYAETINDDSIASFSIGPYSETRRNTGTLAGGRSPAIERLNPWPTLEQLLWLLLSLAPGEVNAQVDERRAYWRSLLQGYNQPAAQLQEVDWTGGRTGRGLFGGGLGWTQPEPTIDVADPVT